MKLKSSTSSILFPATFLLLCASTEAGAAAAAACHQTCGSWTLPFPFGFSPGCQIQLNCSSNTVLADDFRVLSITKDTILVNLPVACSRPVETLGRLFTQNYAPNSLNAVLLQNCSGGSTECMIGTSSLTAELQLDCGTKNYNTSCYSETDHRSSFIDYEKLRWSGCQTLYSAISIESSEVSPSVSLDLQIVRLGWWILGEYCSCSENAICTRVSTPLEGRPLAYRCQCLDGFVGDGFMDGVGCRKGSSAKKIHKVILLGVALSVVGMIILCIVISCFLKMRGLVNGINPKCKQDVKKLLLQHGSLTPKRYKYSEIKKMTKSFSEKLGQGGYGSVYKGMLSDGCPVAVKVLIETDSDGEGFINEVASISRTSHVNIVTLLGFCYEGNRRALVYEFMPNKSLDKFLCNNVTDCCLNLEELYRIAVGIAKGLEYLHKGCTTRIVHFDIKPQNILLDGDFCPKISDFGLAKLCKTQKSILSVPGTRGTIGYIAPEVFSRNFGGVSHKSDVYSYGMMLLEMAGARKLTEAEVIGSSENYFPDKIYEQVIIDATKKLDDLMIAEEEETATKMILVGFWCIQTIPLSRPSISKVVEMLEGSLKSIQIPPKPFLFSPNLPTHEVSTSLSTYLEIENSA